MFLYQISIDSVQKYVIWCDAGENNLDDWVKDYAEKYL